MTSRKRTWLVILVSVLVFLFTAEWMLFETSGIPASGSFNLDIAKVRMLARSSSGAPPVRINSLLLSDGTYPEIAVTAGGRFFTKRRLVNVVYQIVYPNKETIMLDTGNDQQLHDEWSNGRFRPAAYAKLQKALLRARMIFITHEHFDHVGGISKSPHLDKLREKARLTPEQLTGPTIEWADFPAGALEKFKPLKYEKHYSPAPGIVLIKAPGHTVGSQMMYVRTGRGVEYLFVGDIAWHEDNIRRPVGKAMLAALMAKEDRGKTGPQLRALNRLRRETKIHIVVSHDPKQLSLLRSKGLLGSTVE